LDSLHSIVFYACSALALLGGLVAAWTRSRQVAAAGLFVLAAGVSLLLADLSAGFAGVLVFVLLLAAGAASVLPARSEEAPSRRADNLGAIVAALIFAALAYAAYRGVYHSTGYPGGTFNAAALARLLIGRDSLALIAGAATALIAASYLPGRRGAARSR
jgi:hypothetical protein